MPDLIIHDICAIDQADCKLAIEFAGAKHELFARRVRSGAVSVVGEFEPVALFRSLPLSPFQVQQLVGSSVKIRNGGSLNFPLRVPETTPF